MLTTTLLAVDISTIEKKINPMESEQELLNSVESFINSHGKEAFLTAYAGWKVNFSFSYQEKETHVSVSLLCTVLLNDYYQLAEKLLAIGVNPDLGTECQSVDDFNNTSPLMCVIEKKNLVMVELLIKYDANLLHVDGAKRSILMNPTDISEEILDCIISAARKKCLYDLFRIKNKYNSDIFFYCLNKKRFPLLKLLLKKEICSIYIYDIELLLDNARRWSLNAKNHQGFITFDEICSLIRVLPAYRATSIAKNFDSHTYEYCYDGLFGKDPGEPHDKPTALKRALAQIYSFFRSPQTCLDHLHFLNTEFKRYYEETYKQPFPTPDKTLYEYRTINGVLYPIPKIPMPGTEFVGLGKKHNALEKFLIQILDLKDETFQWLGFIPPDIANEMVKNSDFLKETLYGIGLLHGRNAHMLQLALIFSLLRAKLISDSYYDENGELHTLSLKEIAAAFIELKDKDGEDAWKAIRDRRYPEYITICDPHQFCGFLMRDKSHHTWFNADLYDWQALTDSLVDSFCKNILALLTAFKKIIQQENNSDFDAFFFASCLNDLIIRFFGTDAFTEYAIEQAKNIHCQGSYNYNKYAVVAKHYTRDNPDFILNSYYGNLVNIVMSNQVKMLQQLLLSPVYDMNITYEMDGILFLNRARQLVDKYEREEMLALLPDTSAIYSTTTVRLTLVQLAIILEKSRMKALLILHSPALLKEYIYHKNYGFNFIYELSNDDNIELIVENKDYLSELCAKNIHCARYLIEIYLKKTDKIIELNNIELLKKINPSIFLNQLNHETGLRFSVPSLQALSLFAAKKRAEKDDAYKAQLKKVKKIVN